MKNFITTILYFSLPFFLLILITTLIDPYNIIRQERNEKLLKLKKQISYKKNYALYKLQEYYRKPTDIIILGDSRANHLNKHTFESISGEKITNLAYAGGTIPEIVETFWIVNKMHRLKKVYIGINFNLYNALNIRNRVKKADKLRNSIPSYLFSRYCIESSYLIIKSLITGKKINIEKPPYTREEFWKYQLNISAPTFYKEYKYPIKYFNDLKNITNYCFTNKIKLVFFIPPTHTDLQNKIKEFHLEKENEQFKKDLISFNVPVFDFNFKNLMTINKENFRDPFHFQGEYENIIVKVISGKELQKYNDIYRQLDNNYSFFTKQIR
jgi:hypothetical protein